MPGLDQTRGVRT